MKKKILSFMMALCMIIGLVPVVYADETPVVTVASSPKEVAVGEEFTITLHVPAVDKLALAAEFKMDFDTTAFELTGISTPAVKCEGGNVNSVDATHIPIDTANTIGKFTCSYYSGKGNSLDFSNVDISITFAVKEGAELGDYTFALDTANSYINLLNDDNITETPVAAVTAASATTVTIIERVTGVTLDQNTMELTYGADGKLTATVHPDYATNQNVIWSSSDESIVTVDEDGNVTATGVGKAMVTVTTEDGGYQASCVVTVVPLTIKISVDPIGDQSFDNKPLTPAVTVRSEEALTLNQDYTLTYDKNTYVGTATVTVAPVSGSRYTFKTFGTTFEINRIVRVMSATTPVSVIVGNTIDLKALVTSDPSMSDELYDITFSITSGEGLAAIDGTVLTAGDTTGTVEVTAYSPAIDVNRDEFPEYSEASVRITVTITDKEDAKVTITSAADITKTYGDASFDVTAEVGNPGENGRLTWTSSNPDVLTVDQNGKVTIIGAGKATLTASYESDTTMGFAAVAVTVNQADHKIRGRHITLEVGESIDLSTIFSVEGTTLSYSIENGATLSGTILTAGDTPGTYALVVTAAGSTNYRETVRGYDVIVTAKEDDGPIIPIIPITRTYTLTFETNGGSKIQSVRKVAYTNIDLRDFVPTKAGYEFAGWYTDQALTERVTSVKLTKNITVYAKWTKIEGDKPADNTCDGGEYCPSRIYTDVDQSLWYHEGIDFVVVTGMMNGVGNNLFRPHGVTSRAMIVTVLYRLEGEPAVRGQIPFSDVEADTWYTDAVIWAAENGIVEGYGNGKFGPHDDITREQLAKIMYYYADYKNYDVSARADLDRFSDADEISSWAEEEMQWAVAVGLVNGVGGGRIAPRGDAERCQVAAIFQRFCERYVK